MPHALVLKELKTDLLLEERPQPQPAADQVVVELKAAALNRRDFWITRGMYPGIKLPVVLGSDGAGVVVETGSSVGNYWRGREVMINPAWSWGSDQRVQGDSFRILGMPEDGTFATHVVVPSACLHEKPAQLNWHEAAALPVAGLTAYRALFSQGELKAGENVLVNGIGGGVASLAMQFAIAAAAKVLATSSSSSKRDKAAAMGAVAAMDYGESGWHNRAKTEHGAVHLIIDSAGGEGYNSLIDLAAPGGRIVNYGATAGPPEKLDLFKVFWKQLHLIGSTMGSPADFKAMLEFVSKHNIKPIIDEIFPLANGNDALAKMKSSTQFGKIVLDITS